MVSVHASVRTRSSLQSPVRSIVVHSCDGLPAQPLFVPLTDVSGMSTLGTAKAEDVEANPVSWQTGGPPEEPPDEDVPPPPELDAETPLDDAPEDPLEEPPPELPVPPGPSPPPPPDPLEPQAASGRAVRPRASSTRWMRTLGHTRASPGSSPLRQTDGAGARVGRVRVCDLRDAVPCSASTGDSPSSRPACVASVMMSDAVSAFLRLNPAPLG